MIHQLKSWLRRFLTLHLPARERPIFLFSNARSGSTWLMELLASQSGTRFVDEPLNPDQHREPGSPLPPTWEFLLPHPQRVPTIEKYFEQLLRGTCQIGGPRLLSGYYRPLTWRVVFKILRCHDLMSWFQQRFDARMILLLRHPIATNLSRKTVPRLPLFLSNAEYCAQFLTKSQLQLGREVFKGGDELEKKVLDWALQNVPPLKFLDRSAWYCLHYEDLVAQPAAVVADLARALQLPQPETMLKRVHRPSRSVGQSDDKTREFLGQARPEGNYLLSKWRERVSLAEEQRVFELLAAFGLDQYAVGQELPVRRVQPGFAPTGTAENSRLQATEPAGMRPALP